MIGVLFIYLGILLFLHAYMFRNVGTKTPDIMGTTWEFLRMDLKASTVTQNVGGGMIGAGLYSLTFFLVAQLGSYLIAVLLMVIGVFLISMLDFQQVMNGLQVVREKLGSLTAKSEERQTQREAKRAEKRAAKEAKIEQMAQERLRNDVRELTPGEKLAQEARAQVEKNEQEPEQLTLVPIDSFQSQTEAQPLQQKVVAETETEDEGGELDFEISEEAEDRDYELPPSTLLDSIPSADQSGEYKKIEKNIGVLEQTFKSFGVDAKVVKASLG